MGVSSGGRAGTRRVGVGERVGEELVVGRKGR